MAEAVRQYQSVLLSNYRCHAAILRLPGGLFYDSSLQVSQCEREFIVTCVAGMTACLH